jgi:exopolysaccharide biosynthesis polyprenyl glycosylphosphotransferase
MATRPLTNGEVSLLEPIQVESKPLALRPLRRVSWGRGAFLLDLAMLLAAAVATEVGAPVAGVVRTAPVWLALYGGVVVLLLYARGLYSWHVRVQALDDVRSVFTATGLAAMTVLTVRLLLPGNLDDLVSQSIRVWAFSTVYLAAGRVALDWAQVKGRHEGETTRPTLVVGAGHVGRLTASRLLEHPEFGLLPVGFLDKEPLDEPTLPLPVLGASWDLERVLASHSIERVVIAFSTAPSSVLLDLVRRCWRWGVEVALVPRLFEVEGCRMGVEHLGALPLVSVKTSDPRSWAFTVKYALDRMFAAFAIVMLAPVFAFVAAGVLVTMGRPIFFRQRRVGLDGRVFDMLKFRTMRGRPDMAGESDADWAARTLGVTPEALTGRPAADRRTPFGRLLRTLSLDELPQLWNVLRGDMSMIGPRPERAHYVEHFQEAVYRYPDRHRVKSGITGWAQVHGLRGETSLADRVEWDNFYIENWSPWLDLRILMRTVAAIFRGQ